MTPATVLIADDEQTQRELLGGFLAKRGYHVLEAADGPKALYYLERAGNQSMRDGAFREAVKFFSSAIELMDAGSIEELPNRRALWEKDIGIASYYLGDMPASRLHLERALEQLHRPVPDSMGRTLVYVARGFLEQYLHSLFPSRFRGRRAAEKKLLDEAVQCYKQLGQAYYMEGEAPPRLLYLTLSGLNLGEEAGASAPLARVMINAAVLYYVIGRGRSAERAPPAEQHVDYRRGDRPPRLPAPALPADVGRGSRAGARARWRHSRSMWRRRVTSGTCEP